MKHAFKSLVGVTAVASIIAVAGTAAASDATKCHQTIAKSINKYAAGVAKGLVGCHKSRTGNKTVLGSDCNETGVTGQGADQKSKRGANRDKARLKIEDTCNGVGETDILPLYVSCPSPVATSDDGGATTNIDSFTEVANCLMDVAEHYIEVMGERAMGSPTLPASDTAADCQAAIGKNFAKYVKTVTSNRAKCKASEEKVSETDFDYDSSCIDMDPSGKIAPALSSMNAAIVAACGAADGDHDELGNCAGNLASPTENDLVNCAITEAVDPISNGLAAASQELPGIYSAVADVTISAANGDVKANSNTRLDSGWKGTAHQVDVIDQSIGAVNVTNCDADGRNCDVTHNSKNGNCRCDNDPTIECSTIEAADPACGGNTCHCMFGPPLSISASATPVCVVNRFAAEFDGTTQELGEYEVSTRTRALVHTGISQTQPCPICVGDDEPNDGTRNGTCEDGPRNGQPCDENARHPDFGPSSFDCPPSPGANISGLGLNLDLVFESGTSTITASRPAAGSDCDGALACHCSVCTGDSTVGCTVDADCAAVGAGTCGVALANNPAQNNCDTTCSDDDGDLNLGEPEDNDNSGTCDGPIDNYCDGFLNGFGGGVITCDDDGDCDANDCNGDNNTDPDECGDCLHAQFRKCFLPTVTATGVPGIFESEGVSVFCSGQTGNGGVDDAGGLPGPGKVKLSFDFDLYCPNGTTRYQLPGGSNCIP